MYNHGSLTMEQRPAPIETHIGAQVFVFTLPFNTFPVIGLVSTSDTYSL